MNVRISRYFTAIAQHGSMRDAAESLHVAQSALSRSIMNIEQEFGVTMLERHPRGVILTAAGEIFLRYARDNLSQSEQMRDEMDALKGLRRGTVRIHAVESLARSLLPRLISAYWRRYPDVVFDVKTDGSDRIVTAVREAETDIGLTYNSLIGSHIEVRLQVREPLVALMASHHRLARSTAITMRDAACYPVALTTKTSRSRFLVDEACRKERLSLSPVLETNYIDLLTSIVEQSRAITFLLKYSVEDRLEAGMITAVPVRSVIMNRGTIEILTRASRKLSPASEEFVQFLARELQPQASKPIGASRAATVSPLPRSS